LQNLRGFQHLEGLKGFYSFRVFYNNYGEYSKYYARCGYFPFFNHFFLKFTGKTFDKNRESVRYKREKPMEKKPMKRLIFIFSTALLLAFIVSGNAYTDKDTICPQITVYARNPESLEWSAFFSPCEVPEGWAISMAPPPDADDEPAEVSQIHEKACGTFDTEEASRPEKIIWKYDKKSKTVCFVNQDVLLNSCGQRSVSVSLNEAAGVYEIRETDAPEIVGGVPGRCRWNSFFDFQTELSGINSKRIKVRLFRSIFEDENPLLIWEGELNLRSGQGSEFIEDSLARNGKNKDYPSSESKRKKEEQPDV
jgi:hypothetical protein